MILLLISVPFGAAFVYFYASRVIVTRYLRDATPMERLQMGVDVDQPAKVLDERGSIGYIRLMMLMFIPALPILIVHWVLFKLGWGA